MDSFEFWRFSLWVYHQEAVAPACLKLQERHGIDVNILLFALWLGQCGQKVDQAVLEELTAGASDWHVAVVLPLRSIRKALKAWGHPTPSEAVSNFREKIKADEIGAERLEQWFLFQAALRLLDLNFEFKESPYMREDLSRTNALSYLKLLHIATSEHDDALIVKLAKVVSAFTLKEDD
jgi:uncharacterized protein (TIGR02444 family)